MKIKLSDILSVANKKVDINASLEMTQVDFQNNIYDITDSSPFVLTLLNHGKNKLGIKVDTKLTLLLYCGRCLTELPEEFYIHIEEVIDLDEEKERTLIEEIYYVDKGFLDVDKLILDELFPMIPIQSLCDDNCKGICKVCGANRNDMDCGCDQSVMDPRMAVFGEVFSQFNLENK